MEAIANLVIAAMDLAEAEGRAAHRGVIRLLVRALAILGAAILGLVGILLVGWGVFLAVAYFVGPIWAAFACGVFLLLCAVGLFIYGKIAPRSPGASRVVDVSDKRDYREGQSDETLRAAAAAE
jgi:hypothetical protein